MKRFIVATTRDSFGFADALRQYADSEGWHVTVHYYNEMYSWQPPVTLDGWIGVIDKSVLADKVILEDVRSQLVACESAGVFSAVVSLSGAQLDDLPAGRLVAANADQVKETFERLKGAQDDFEATLGAMLLLRRQRKKEVLGAAEEYVDATLIGLGQRATNFLLLGILWHVIAASALSAGAVAGIWRISTLPQGELGQGTLLSFVSTFVGIVGLLLALAKYAVNLGRFFAHEAIMLANRQHAIRYGRFYLMAFGDSVDRKEVSAIMRDWNIVSISSNIPRGNDERSGVLDVLPKIYRRDSG